MSLYNADGQINLTVVSGSTYTGLYAPDGSWNIVINDGSTYKGFYHPCGAINAVASSNTNSRLASNGSLNIVSNNFGGYSPVSPSGSSDRPVGYQFLTVTDSGGNQQFLTVKDSNGVEQRLTVIG